MPIKTVFFGTHEFAAKILEGLINSPLFEVVLVISRPDEPVGRKQIIVPTPVKKLALSHGIHVEQPNSLKNFKFLISNFQLGITAQYGGLIPKHILEAPAHGILNVHTSLLPKYRGASPIQSAIMNGDTETGVTVMKMDEGLDTGPILLQEKVKIDDDMTAPELEKILAQKGVQALLDAAPTYCAGTLTPKTQSDDATTCKKLTRDDGKIDWKNMSADVVYNRYRALTPWPGIWTTWEGKRIKLLRISKHTEINDAIIVACQSGSIAIHELQLEGKNPVSATAFIAGHPKFNNNLFS